jgi:hypothetical protein
MATFTMRLQDRDHEALQAMALLTGRPMAELARQAIVNLVHEFAASGEPERILQNEASRRDAAARTVRHYRDTDNGDTLQAHDRNDSAQPWTGTDD